MLKRTYRRKGKDEKRREGKDKVKELPMPQNNCIDQPQHIIGANQVNVLLHLFNLPVVRLVKSEKVSENYESEWQRVVH